MDKIRVRYAPSPTGYLHIGNARTALFNYLFTKNLNGDFIIRVEDTDVSRNIENGVESQLSNLRWLGIDWDESVDKKGKYGPYNQLKRLEEGLYKPFIDKLLEEKKAYKCFCTSEELEKEATRQKEQGQIPKYQGKCCNLSEEEINEKEKSGIDYTIRFKVEKDIDIKWDDIVKGNVLFNSNDVSGDFNIVKRDGIPTYNFAVVIDDHLMEISHVLRGEDHISNTPKQIMIYNALGLSIPKFGHMALIVNQEGKKLSKRDGGIIQFIEQYKDLGYIPEAMFNFISLLGWSPETEEEIFSKEEFIKLFDANRLSKSSAKFDVAKLTWINNMYMKSLDEEKYKELVYPFLKEEYNIDLDKRVEKIMMLYKNQISYGKEIVEVSKLFFKEFEISSEGKEFLLTLEEKKVQEIKEVIIKKISDDKFDLNAENVKELINLVKEETGLKGKNLFMPIRILTTGQMHGPELSDTLEILGKENLLKNLR